MNAMPDKAGGDSQDSTPMTTQEVVTSTVAAILSGGIIYKLLGGVVKTLRSGAGLVKNLFSVPGLKPLANVPGLGNVAGAAADAAGGATKSMSSMGASLADGIKSIGGAVGDAIRGMTSLLADVLGKLSSVLVSLADTLGKAIASISEGLGKAIAAIVGGIGKGLGVALGAILEGLSIGLKAMADPYILLGAAILGGSITLIGAGIAGATWIMGAALPKMAEGLKSFTDIDGTKLEQTGNGMIKIGAGLAAMGAGEVVNSLGSLTGWISSFFSDDPITKLKRFGEIAEPLKAAGDAMSKFADAYPRVIYALNNASISQTAFDTMDKLKLLFKGDRLLASDTIRKQIALFGELAEPLNAASEVMGRFGEAYARAFDLINTGIFSKPALDTLAMLDLIFRDGAFVLMGNWLLGSNEIMARLANLETETGNIPLVADRLYYFADAYSYLVDAFADSISIESLSNLFSLSDLINRQATLAIPNVISSTFGATAAPGLSGGGPVATNPTAGGTGTTSNGPHSPEQRHKEMMAALNKLNNNIESLLLVEDRQVRVMSDGFSKVAAVVY
jgi:hypothetical protein